MEYINTYLTNYSAVYAQATAVTDKVNNRLWGGSSVSAIDNTFVDVKIKPWAPPPCDGTNGYVEETYQLCNENLVPSSGYSSSPMEQVDTGFPASWGPATDPVWDCVRGQLESDEGANCAAESGRRGQAVRVGRSGHVPGRAIEGRGARPVGRAVRTAGRPLRVGPAGRSGGGLHGRAGLREAGGAATGGRQKIPFGERVARPGSYTPVRVNAHFFSAL